MDSDFYSLPTYVLENEQIRLTYLAKAGPRIVGFSLAGSNENILATVPEASTDTINGRYFFRGGHRLWHAPEMLQRTYIPDDDGLTIETLPNGVRLCQPTEIVTGIRKEMSLHLDAQRPFVTIHHRLTNEGVWDITLAPWAITQLKLGGTAVLPQFTENVDAAGLLPNRHLVLWPYTSWQDSRLQFNDTLWHVHGKAGLPACKIGTFNRLGWLAYQWHGLWFCKRFTPQLGCPHPDQNCNVEVYVNHQFIELETLGPLTKLAPGEAVSHTETWELYQQGSLPPIWTNKLTLNSNLP